MLLFVGVAWTFLVVSYESPLGTNNRVLVSDPNDSLSNGSTDELVSLSFAEGGEDLAWTSVQIEITANEQQYTCSFGSQSAEDLNEGKVRSTLGADGSTFTTVIDATSDAFTYFDLPNQQESNASEHTMKFSKSGEVLPEFEEAVCGDGESNTARLCAGGVQSYGGCKPATS